MHSSRPAAWPPVSVVRQSVAAFYVRPSVRPSARILSLSIRLPSPPLPPSLSPPPLSLCLSLRHAPGKYLEHTATGRTSQALTKLMALQARTTPPL